MNLICVLVFLALAFPLNAQAPVDEPCVDLLGSTLECVGRVGSTQFTQETPTLADLEQQWLIDLARGCTIQLYPIWLCLQEGYVDYTCMADVFASASECMQKNAPVLAPCVPFIVETAECMSDAGFRCPDRDANVSFKCQFLQAECNEHKCIFDLFQGTECKSVIQQFLDCFENLNEFSKCLESSVKGILECAVANVTACVDLEEEYGELGGNFQDALESCSLEQDIQ